MSCIFCNIVSGKSPAQIVHEDDNVIVIPDIAPQAPVHLLVIPKRHLASILDTKGCPELWESVVATVDILTKTTNIQASGFRVVTNTGDEGGQSVHHLHIHILGGRPMIWPPG
jgi:histidine triad (HIT) family protein